jgi:hypothetical protein
MIEKKIFLDASPGVHLVDEAFYGGGSFLEKWFDFERRRIL